MLVKPGVEYVFPYNNKVKKATQIRQMFDSIAKKYDLLNHTLSLGLDRMWRKKGICFLKQFSPSSILDLATGTGDLAISMCKQLKPEIIIGADISEGMMSVGRKKAADEGLSGRIRFEYQDALSMTYADNSFDVVTAAFGVRNYENIEQGLKEMHRVLKPRGVFMILELTTPGWFPMKQLYRLYSCAVIPAVGKLVSREGSAYDYLPASVKAMPQGEEMRNILAKAGFNSVRVTAMALGICSMYTGIK